MNVLKPAKKAALTTLLNNKISQHEISRKAKIDRKTIRKYGRQINAASSSAEGADSGFLDEAMVATGSFRKVIWKSSQEAWARLHEEAFRYFGGCPEYVVLDNLKEGVIKPDIYEPELNPLYRAVLTHYGVTADPARVRDPDRKGTVENAIQHTQNTALKGRVFEAIDEQNKWLIHWEENWAAKRIHGRMKRQVEEMFQEEKPFLLPLPLIGFKYFLQETRMVSDDGTIQVGLPYYAARPAPLHEDVIVRIYAGEIEIIDPRSMEKIRAHQKSHRAGEAKMEPEDRIFNPSMDNWGQPLIIFDSRKEVKAGNEWLTHLAPGFENVKPDPR